MVTAVGHISGGHFNPAVTLGFLVTRRIHPINAVVYWIAQFGGAALAVLLIKWVLPAATSPYGAPALTRCSTRARAWPSKPRSRSSWCG